MVAALGLSSEDFVQPPMTGDVPAGTWIGYEARWRILNGGGDNCVESFLIERALWKLA